MSAACPLLSPVMPRSPQRGTGMIEFAVVALPVVFLGLGSIELAHWFYARQAVSLALMDAGRAAITDHNRPARLITTFEQALRPMYASPTATATTRRLHQALGERQKRMNGAPWQIEVLSPSAHAYTDFSDPGLHIAGASGRPAINNHYLAEQDRRHRSRGWPDGRGPASGQTVYEANTAVLRLSWLHESRLPLMAPILRTLGNPRGSYRQRALAQGYLPMTRQITMLMQSHPVHWADDPAEKVIYRNESSASDPACSGWLCGAHASTPGLPPVSTTVPGTDAAPPAQPGLPATPPANNGMDNPDLADRAIDPDDPACGVILCCV